MYILKNKDRYEEGDLDIPDNCGNTALYYAVLGMHIQALEILIRLGANVNRKCELGNTPLHYAMMIGDKILKNKHIISTLVLSGANPKIANQFN